MLPGDPDDRSATDLGDPGGAVDFDEAVRAVSPGGQPATPPETAHERPGLEPIGLEPPGRNAPAAAYPSAAATACSDPVEHPGGAAGGLDHRRHLLGDDRASSAKTAASSPSPRATGLPASPPWAMSGWRGTVPTRGTPSSAARRPPPPEPNSA